MKIRLLCRELTPWHTGRRHAHRIVTNIWFIVVTCALVGGAIPVVERYFHPIPHIYTITLDAP